MSKRVGHHMDATPNFLEELYYEKMSSTSSMTTNEKERKISKYYNETHLETLFRK